MSKNQTTLSIDKETKTLAEKKAKIQNMSVSAVARILLRDYAMGRLEIGAIIPERDENGFTAQKAKELDSALSEIEDEENLSPIFNDSNKAINWLRQNS